MARQGSFDFGIVRRAPYIVAAVLFLLSLFVWDAGRRAFASDAGRTPGWDWLVVGYTALVVLTFIWMPRTLKRIREAKPDAAVLPAIEGVRYVVAMAPLLLSFCAVVLGADMWIMTAALVLSGLLLVIAARTTATQE